MAGHRNVDWPATLIKKEGPYIWIRDHLFPNDFWTADAFEAAVVFYRCVFPDDYNYNLRDFVFHDKRNPIPFSPADLEAAITNACREEWGTSSVYWWHVNVHGNMTRCVE